MASTRSLPRCSRKSPRKSAGLAGTNVRGPVPALEGRPRANWCRDCANASRRIPNVSELRVLFGMALCVDFKVQEAMEELREGVRLAPDSFIAQLKMGELWMRLRVCEKAEEHTHQAALLARNMAQSELARRQAAAIRTMMHNGIKRGGFSYKGPWHLVTRSAQTVEARDRAESRVPWPPQISGSCATGPLHARAMRLVFRIDRVN